jgi:hypothetical protein
LATAERGVKPVENTEIQCAAGAGVWAIGQGGGKGQVTLMAAVLQIMGIRAPEARIRNAKAALITALAAFASGASFAGSSLTLISRFQAQSLAASLPLGAASCSFTLAS